METINSEFSGLVNNGIAATASLLISVAIAFMLWSIVKAITSKMRDHRKRKKKLSKKNPKAHDPNKFEREWQAEEMKEVRQHKAISPDERKEKQREMAERRELYRINRKQNQWKK